MHPQPLHPLHALFDTGLYQAVELRESDAPCLQRFFERNPEYCLAMTGGMPCADEALNELRATPPADWHSERCWHVGFLDAEGQLQGYASLVEGARNPGTWHIAVFMVATRLQGSGVARRLYAALEAWMCSRDARHIELVMLQSMARACRFWIRHGFATTHREDNVTIGRLQHTLLRARRTPERDAVPCR